MRSKLNDGLPVLREFTMWEIGLAPWMGFPRLPIERGEGEKTGGGIALGVPPGFS